MKRIDLLVQYKGGGFAGCYWEWNYFAFDSQGNFHDIGSSGYKAIIDEATALGLLQNEPNISIMGSRDYYTYPLTTEGLKIFADESNASHVKAVAEALEELLGITVFAHCSECGRLLSVAGLDLAGWSGDGGISYSAKDLICYECDQEDRQCSQD